MEISLAPLSRPLKKRKEVNRVFVCLFVCFNHEVIDMQRILRASGECKRC